MFWAWNTGHFILCCHYDEQCISSLYISYIYICYDHQSNSWLTEFSRIITGKKELLSISWNSSHGTAVWNIMRITCFSESLDFWAPFFIQKLNRHFTNTPVFLHHVWALPCSHFCNLLRKTVFSFFSYFWFVVFSMPKARDEHAGCLSSLKFCL